MRKPLKDLSHMARQPCPCVLYDLMVTFTLAFLGSILLSSFLYDLVTLIVIFTTF